MWLSPNGPFWQDAGRSIAATAEDDPVRVWDDSSGNDLHVTAASDANRPALKLALLGLRNGIEGDGSDDALTVTWAADLSAASTFAVLAKALTPTGDAYQPLMRLTTANPNAIQKEASFDGTSPDKLEAFLTQSAGGTVRATPAGTADDQFRSYISIYDGSFLSLYRDGEIWGGPTAATAPNSGIGSEFRVMEDESGQNGNFQITEVLVFDYALNASELAALDTYLRG